MFQRLLVPLDGSENAKVALMYAAAIPSEAVRLLTVLSDEDAGIGFAPPDMQDQWRAEWRTAIESQLKTATEPFLDQSTSIEIEVVFGSPAEWIDVYAQDADLIIMTTHGRGAGGRAVFGSVADRIARTSRTPVMLIRGGDRPVTAQAIVRLVVGLDGSELAEQSLPLTGRLARELDLPVLLVRVIDLQQAVQIAQIGASPVSQYAGSVEMVRKGVEAYLETTARDLRDAGVDVETAVIDGSAAPALLDATLPGDVLVLTSHGRGGLGRWMLGSVTEKLIQEGHVPVLVVRSQPASES